MASILNAYNAGLKRRPILYGCCTAATLFGAGDVLAQQAVERKGFNHDLVRTARLTFYGGAIFAPLVTRWLGVLQRVTFRSKAAVVVSQVGLDQFVAAPTFITIFYTSMTLLEGKGFSDVQARLKAAWAPTLYANWGVFIPVATANFAIVPPHLRLVVINVVSLFWNAYLSFANSRSQKSE